MKKSAKIEHRANRIRSQENMRFKIATTMKSKVKRKEFQEALWTMSLEMVISNSTNSAIL